MTITNKTAKYQMSQHPRQWSAKDQTIWGLIMVTAKNIIMYKFMGGGEKGHSVHLHVSYKVQIKHQQDLDRMSRQFSLELSQAEEKLTMLCTQA